MCFAGTPPLYTLHPTPPTHYTLHITLLFSLLFSKYPAPRKFIAELAFVGLFCSDPLYPSPSFLLTNMITLTIKSSNAEKATVEVESVEVTILELKEKITEVLAIEASRQRLIFKGRVMKDDVTLTTYGINDNDTIHVSVFCALCPVLCVVAICLSFSLSFSH